MTGMPLRMSMEATPADTTVNDISAIKSLNNSLVGVNLTLYGGATLFGVKTILKKTELFIPAAGGVKLTLQRVKITPFEDWSYFNLRFGVK